MTSLGYRYALVTLATPQLERLVDFYAALLTLSPQLRMAGYAEFVLPGLRLGIFQPQPTHAAEFSDAWGAAMSLCLEVEDLDAAIAHFTALGYSPSGTVTVASHGRELYAYDPDGNRLIVHQAHRP